MTTEEQDALVGRVIRELKVAEGELQQLLVRAEQIASDVQKLGKEVSDRVARAKNAGSPMEYAGIRIPNVNLPKVHSDTGIEFGHLKSYAKAVDLDGIEQLDREIGVAVAKVLQLREQKRQLGV